MKRPSIAGKNRLLAVFLAIALAIHLFSLSPSRVEALYATGIYPGIAKGLRRLTGWIPFSIGDIIYITITIYLLLALVQLIRSGNWRKREQWKKITGIFIRSILLIYIVFNILWGINYTRKGITFQMGFERNTYSKEELHHINILLLEKVNQCKEKLIENKISNIGTKELFERARDVYHEAAKTYPFLQYTPGAVKPSLLGWLGNYWGFSGYYNPFTGEAQVNMEVPKVSQPFIAVHEIAHQLGYARENEANFAGYIAATASSDTLFMYSAYFDLFLYANRSLRRMDSLEAKVITARLHPAAKQDLEELKQYYLKYENPVEPVIRWIYGKYLQANDQPAGMMSYSEVVADLIGYYKKYGTIAARP